jgi:hypothetical protein
VGEGITSLVGIGEPVPLGGSVGAGGSVGPAGSVGAGGSVGVGVPVGAIDADGVVVDVGVPVGRRLGREEPSTVTPFVGNAVRSVGVGVDGAVGQAPAVIRSGTPTVPPT